MSIRTKQNHLFIIVALIMGCCLIANGPVWAAESASKGATRTTQELRDNFDKAFVGKTIAFVPITMGLPLTITWKNTLESEAKALGMKFVLRDPNMDPAATTQAVSSLIAERPDVLIVHNPSIQLLAKLLKKAEKAGIHVIQINMASSHPTAAYVGADFYNIAQQTALDIVKECGQGSGKSGKVAIVQGVTTSSVAIEQLAGAMSVFDKHPEIKVVSNQAGNWDANKARDVTATVLKQHPDLCSVMGHWGYMDLGSGQAIKEAGLTGKVLNYSNGGGPDFICQAIQGGLIDKYWNFDAELQGHDIMAAVKMILQSGLNPGQLRMSLFSEAYITTKENADGACWEMPK